MTFTPQELKQFREENRGRFYIPEEDNEIYYTVANMPMWTREIHAWQQKRKNLTPETAVLEMASVIGVVGAMSVLLEAMKTPNNKKKGILDKLKEELQK